MSLSDESFVADREDTPDNAVPSHSRLMKPFRLVTHIFPLHLVVFGLDSLYTLHGIDGEFPNPPRTDKGVGEPSSKHVSTPGSDSPADAVVELEPRRSGGDKLLKKRTESSQNIDQSYC